MIAKISVAYCDLPKGTLPAYSTQDLLSNDTGTVYLI
jgi:hypothetical protein